MKANPNANNLILPCTQTFNLHRAGATAVSSVIERNYFYAHDPDADEYTMYGGMIPNNCKEGSDVDIMVVWCSLVINNTGSDKAFRILPSYSYLRDGEVIQTLSTGTPILVIVPDGEADKTIHVSRVMIVAGLAANDIIGVRILRDADHVDDTWVEDILISFQIFGKYTADKVGVV